jgi:uncharacterized protein (DUF983 family)
MDFGRAASLIGRGLRLRCPRCGERTLFRGPFSMYPDCVRCHLRFEREHGYFIGAIYINYGVTAVIMITGFLLLDHVATPSLAVQLTLWGAFSLGFPLLFFRYARSLWLSLDYLFNPEDPASGGPRNDGTG